MNIFKRMGSASSSVRAVSIDPESEQSSRPRSNRKISSGKDKELKRLNEQIVNLEVSLEQTQRENEELKTKLQLATQKLENAEQEVERLTDQNKLLEDQLDSFEQEETITAANFDISESLKIKEQTIAKLEEELQLSRDSVKSMKQKCKTKLQSMRADLSKTKQEQSLKIFELKDELSMVKQENEDLLVKLESLGGDRSDTTANRDSMASVNRSNIIIELSTQISDQEYRISSLENQLEEKDLLIAKLKGWKLSPRDAKSLIAIETEKTTREMESLAKELKMLKRKKNKNKAERQRAIDSDEYLRDESSLSRDSGAHDLTSPKQSNSHKMADPYSLYTPSHPELTFTSSSTLVT